MNIGILYICTGKYDKFFSDFYKSCEKNFLPNHKKTYYVWTDSKDPAFEREGVIKIYQPKLGWPYDTMARFQMFISRGAILEDQDYLFFINANMIVCSKVGDEILPSDENDGLVGVKHPSFFNVDPNWFPYERHEMSGLKINQGQGKIYYQGCFNGGKTKEFLSMSEELKRKIDEDAKLGIIPIWHDESALNWYFNKKNPLALSPSYAYPENWEIPFEKKIIQLDKATRGGHEELRS